MRASSSFPAALLAVLAMVVVLITLWDSPSQAVGENHLASIVRVSPNEIKIRRHDESSDFTVSLGSVGYRPTKTIRVFDPAVALVLPVVKTSHLHYFYSEFLVDAQSGNLYAIVVQSSTGDVVKIRVDREQLSTMGMTEHQVQQLYNSPKVPAQVINLIPDYQGEQ